MSFTITVDDTELRATLGRLLARLQDPTPALEDVARLLANTTEDSFQTETSPWGKRWPDLKPATEERRAKAGKWPGPKLQVEGLLAASVTHGADGSSAWVGVAREYAALHQFGGTPDMPPGPAAVPARPYLPIDAEGRIPMALRARILQTVLDHLKP